MKKINPDVINLLTDCKINVDAGLGYLLCLANNIMPVYIPDKLKQIVHSTGIIVFNDREITWKMPLFGTQETEFGWLNEWRELFKPFDTHNKNKKEVNIKMKKLFAENPEVRVEDVMEATKLYVREKIRDGFPRLPHYFISKGIGLNKVSDLLSYVDIYKDSAKDYEDEGDTLTTGMQ